MPMGETPVFSKVVVQRITTIWTKRTRGAAGREHRARLPQAYPLPDSVMVARLPCASHLVYRAEASAYREQSSVGFDSQPRARIGIGPSAVELAYRGDGLQLAFRGDVADTGRPVRAPLPPRLLLRGDVASVRFNGRFTGHEDAWYEEKIVHIAFDVTPRRDLFLSASVAHVIDARVDLW
jgi:hypothetical protein